MSDLEVVEGARRHLVDARHQLPKLDEFVEGLLRPPALPGPERVDRRFEFAELSEERTR